MAILKKLWSPDHRWKTLLTGWILCSALAMWGMLAASPPDMTFWDMLYALPDFFGMTA